LITPPHLLQSGYIAARMLFTWLAFRFKYTPCRRRYDIVFSGSAARNQPIQNFLAARKLMKPIDVLVTMAFSFPFSSSFASA
jgi:hypothetical protein